MAWLVHSEDNLLTQGVIVDNVDWGLDPNPLSVILSNPCDLEHNKASYIMVACLIPAKETIQASKEFIEKVPQKPTEDLLSKEKSEKLKRFLSGYIFNVDITRYFFIDPNNTIEVPHLFVDFQRIITFPIGLASELDVLGVIPSPHKEKMIMHFASYISRIGVDRVEHPRLSSILNELSEPYKLKEN